MGDNLTIVDDVYTLTNLRTRCKKMAMLGKLDVVFIDYLQLIVHKVDAGVQRPMRFRNFTRVENDGEG